MKTTEKKTLPIILILGLVAITLVMTPTFNKDSLIIPKVIILFCLAMFFIPIAVKNRSLLTSNAKNRNLSLIAILIAFNGVIVLINSSSPIDQLLFGRTGRGLGFITFLSALIILTISSIILKSEDLSTLLKGMVFAGFSTCIYACLQFFGLDLFSWDSKTNGIIGTLGNPNSLSSFAAMVLIPSVALTLNLRQKFAVAPILVLILGFTIFISRSTQGYIGAIASVAVFLLFYFWYKNRLFFNIILVSSVATGIVAIFGMLGKGPLSYYLYKVSVQSRGDFWRSAFTTGNSHPILGVGFDSFGDFSLKYRDEVAASHSFAEYTDSAHNFYLDYLATGGYPFMLLHLVLTLFVLRSIFMIQKIYNSFNLNFISLVCAWTVVQLQTIINTQTITFIAWNAVLSGAIIGLAGHLTGDAKIAHGGENKFKREKTLNFPSILFLVLGILISFPYFNSDRLMLKAINTGNGDLLIQSTTSFPQTVTKYSQASRALLESGLPAPSLYLAQKAVEFNSNAVSLWALILVNPNASLSDRQNAKNKILELDPFNKEVRSIILE